MTDTPKISHQEQVLHRGFVTDRANFFARDKETPEKIDFEVFKQRLGVRLSWMRTKFPAVYFTIIATDAEAFGIAKKMRWPTTQETGRNDWIDVAPAVVLAKVQACRKLAEEGYPAAAKACLDLLRTIIKAQAPHHEGLVPDKLDSTSAAPPPQPPPDAPATVDDTPLAAMTDVQKRALLANLRADDRLPNRGNRIRSLCIMLELPALDTDPPADDEPPPKPKRERKPSSGFVSPWHSGDAGDDQLVETVTRTESTDAAAPADEDEGLFAWR